MILGDDSGEKFSSIIVVIDETNVYATSTDNINFNDINSSINWFNLGTDGLPDCNISDIVYDKKDDVLYLSMYGRGVWKCNDIVKKFVSINHKLLNNSYSIKSTIKPKYDKIGIGVINPNESLEVLGNMKIGIKNLPKTDLKSKIIDSTRYYTEFDGESQVDVNLSRNISNNFTFVTWINVSQLRPDGETSSILLSEDTNDPSNNISIYLNQGQVEIKLGNDTLIGIGAITHTHTMEVDTWYHLAVTISDEAPYLCKLVIDNTSVIFASGNYIKNVSRNTKLGKNSTNNLIGKLRNTYFFGKELTSDEIAAIFTNNTLPDDKYIIGTSCTETTLSVTNNVGFDKKVGIGTNEPSVSLDIISNSAIRIPVGNTSQRPIAQDGLIRYNTENSEFEGYGNANWGSLGGVKNPSGSTKIIATKSTDLVNADELQMTTNNVERINISSDGIVDFKSTSAIKVPVGNDTTDKPVGVEGYVRYNTVKKEFEGYGNNNWGSLGGVKNVQGDTYIKATDSDNIEFYTSGTKHIVINSNGDVNAINSEINASELLGELTLKSNQINVQSSQTMSYSVSSSGGKYIFTTGDVSSQDDLELITGNTYIRFI